MFSKSVSRGGGEPLFISVVGDGIEWTLGGSDTAYFSIDSPSGALRFDLDPVAPVVVAKAPDFEAPANSGTDKAYVVTLLPSSGSAMAVSALSVTVTVSDVDEDGKVSLSTKRPRKDVAVTVTPGPPTASEPAAGWSLPEKGQKNFTCPTVRGVSRGPVLSHPHCLVQGKEARW